MATIIKTVDNFNSFGIEQKQQSIGFSFCKDKYFFSSSAKCDNIYISLDGYKKNKNNIFFSFFEKDEDKKRNKNSDDLILSISKNSDGSFDAKSGNYIGKLKYNGDDIEIKSRFGDDFLKRMLNFANDVYLDDVSIVGENIKNEEIDYSKFIIYYMFVQNLEKAFLLGLPKSYTTIKHHESTLKGKIDINRFIKHDIPFKGKISSVSREQKEIQEIIDVLYKAVKIIGKNNKGFLKNISHIVPHLKEMRSNSYVSKETINKALKSESLQNPIFAPYKKVLQYAKFIINGNNIEEKNKGTSETYGFIINVAELFEIYTTKLLQKEFPQWNVSSPKLPLYFDNKMFYARNIIPDIVMIKDNDVMVFDTKYKKMKMRGTKENIWDVDRNDFFQIITYISYYQNQNYNVKVGGLLYPMEEFEQSQCHSETWLGNQNTKFIVDGIDLSEDGKDSIIKAEKDFIGRLREIS